MAKYEAWWCRILEFKEQVEAETEEEVYETILEERKTAGSTVEIISVMPLDIEKVKRKAKKETKEKTKELYGPQKTAQEVEAEAIHKRVMQKKKEKK